MQLAKAFVEVGLASPEAAKKAEWAIEAQRLEETRHEREAQAQAGIGPEVEGFLRLKEAVKAAKVALEKAVHRYGYIQRCHGSYHEYCEWWVHPACDVLKEGDTFPPGTSVSLD
jgi:hypothetical protein